MSAARKNLVSPISRLERSLAGAYAAVEQLSTNRVLMRKGKGVKKLVEEIIPIAAFLKHLRFQAEELGASIFLAIRIMTRKFTFKAATYVATTQLSDFLRPFIIAVRP
jgi:hypothetical protein